MAEKFNGKYELVSQENLDGYLKVLGLDEALIKTMVSLKLKKEFVIDGKHMTIKTLSDFRNYILDFTLGEEFEEDLAPIDGRICKSKVMWEGNKLVCVQKGEVPNRTIKHWLEGDLLRMELTAKNAICTQTFRRV